MTANFPESPASTNLNKKALIVLGMHRSGTSALTRVLNICGAALPQKLMIPQSDNELGFWESSEIMALHDQLLASAGSSWDDFSLFPPSWFNSAEALEYQPKMLALLEEEFGDSPLFVLKDPRICRLVPFWLKVLEAFAAQPYFIIPVRHPLEVAASLKQRNGFNQAKSLLLWLQYFLAAERDTRNLPRIFLTYEQLLFDWQGVISKIEQELGIALPKRSHQVGMKIEQFLRLDLRHHQEKLKDLSLRKDLVNWVAKAYDWGQRASQGEVVSVEELDQIYTEILEADKAYGLIVAEAQLEKSKFESKNQEQTARITSLEKELEIKEFKLNQIQREIRAKEQDLEKLKQALETEKQVVENLQNQLKNQEQNAKEMQQALEAEKQVVKNLQTQLKSKETIIISQPATNSQGLNQTDEAQNKLLEQYQAGLLKRDRRIENLESDLARIKNETAKVKSSLPWKVLIRLQTLIQPLIFGLKLIYWTLTFKLPEKLQQEKIYSAIVKSGLFDRNFYLLSYPDVAEAGVDPIRHYVTQYHEGRNPNPNFNTNFYLQAHPDVARAKMHPFYHYVLYGRNENRATKP